MQKRHPNRASRMAAMYPKDAFRRLDEKDDEQFYQLERPVAHVDQRALETIRHIIGQLVVEDHPVILDLMAGYDSHLPDSLQAKEVVGLGLNPIEMEHNPRLTQHIVHNLNRDPSFPFDDNRFDVVLNCLSVDYLTQPFDVFREIQRVLKPGGLLLVVFSNRFFRQKVIKLWSDSNELERHLLVEDYFSSMDQMGPLEAFISRGKPRPKDDKYAGLGLPSDPIWALWAEKQGTRSNRPKRPAMVASEESGPSAQLVQQRKKRVAQTLCCPYCEEKLTKFEIPASPFVEWPNEYMYVCYNNDCPYLIAGWDTMTLQGNHGFSYRLMYNPDSDTCMPVPVPGLRAQQQTVIAPRG